MSYKSPEKKREKSKALYFKRKAQSICTNCGRGRDNETLRCVACREKTLIASKQKRREGKCYGCGKPQTSGMTRCVECRNKRKQEYDSRVNQGLCCKCNELSAPNKKHCETHLAASNKRNLNTKIEAFNSYGGTQCACCGESTIEFLQLDHINNNGAAHRKQGLLGCRLYRHLKRNGYPSGYQVLCANCNFAKGILGYCPHKTPTELKLVS